MGNDEGGKKSSHDTIPRTIKAIAALVIAITGLIGGLYGAGIFNDPGDGGLNGDNGNGLTDFISQPSYTGDCANRPIGSVCISYSDGYIWLVFESIESNRNYYIDSNKVEVAIGGSYEYHHVIGTTMVKQVIL